MGIERVLTHTLNDHNGIWCGWCLKYFDKDDMIEQHHFIPRHIINKIYDRFNNDIDLQIGWVIPVHKDGCHRKDMQNCSDSSGRFLVSSLSKPDKEIERLASNAFHIGCLNHAVILRRIAKHLFRMILM